MKKLLFLLFTSILLFGCQENTDTDQALNGSSLSYPTSFTAESEDFLYELDVNHSKINYKEAITITASLTYIGNLDEIVITHAASPFYFELKEKTRNFTIDYPMDQPLVYTTLRKNEPLQVTYTPSGGYSDADSESYRAFMDEFLTGNYPVGYYIVSGTARFTVEESGVKESIGGYVGFEVKE